MSGTDKRKVYYWDACDYLAWLKDEQKAHGKDCIEALRRIAKESFEMKSVLLLLRSHLLKFCLRRLTKTERDNSANPFATKIISATMSIHPLR